MRFGTVTRICAVLDFGPFAAIASPLLETRQSISGISQSTYDDLVRYTKYSSAVYHGWCPKPLGNTLVRAFDTNGSQGFVVRDDRRKEIVVVFRGTREPIDLITDIQFCLTPLLTRGVDGVGDSQVHSGFLRAYNLVADDVLDIVGEQRSGHSDYSIVVSGHSLGGAMASISALAIRAAHPSVPLKLYTYGQPRTGNPAFAALVEQKIGVDNIFRAVHTNDIVPTILVELLGYRHFGTEYWNFQDPASPANTRKCTGAEDPTCSRKTFPGNLLVHPFYFGEGMTLNPLLCWM